MNKQAERIGAEEPGIREARVGRGKYVATSARAAPTSATPASSAWRAFGTMGERNMTSIPNPQSTISGAILYKSWMGGNIYFDFTESAELP